VLQEQLLVERLEEARIDDRRPDAARGQEVRRFQRCERFAAERPDGDVGALAQDFRLPPGERAANSRTKLPL
jgi:hypothetical protein